MALNYILSTIDDEEVHRLNLIWSNNIIGQMNWDVQPNIFLNRKGYPIFPLESREGFNKHRVCIWNFANKYGLLTVRIFYFNKTIKIFYGSSKKHRYSKYSEETLMEICQTIVSYLNQNLY